MGDTFFTFLCATLVLEAALALTWLEIQFHCAVCQHTKSDHVKLGDCAACEEVDRGCRYEKTPVPREVAQWLARERQGIRALLEPPPIAPETVSLEHEAHNLWLRENAGRSLGLIDTDGIGHLEGPFALESAGIVERVDDALVRDDPLRTKLTEFGVPDVHMMKQAGWSPTPDDPDYGVFTGDFRSRVQRELVREEEVLKFYSEHLPREILGLQPDDERRFPVDVWWAHGKKSLVITCFAAPRTERIEMHTIHTMGDAIDWHEVENSDLFPFEPSYGILTEKAVDKCKLIVLHPDDLDRVLRGELRVPEGFGEIWQRLF